MIEYQPSVIQEHARRLYSRANSIIAIYGLFGVMVGGVGALSLADEVAIQLMIAFAGCLLGAAVGWTQSFKLRLEAQLALCQVQIEQHTRQAASILSPPSQQPQPAHGPRG